MKKWGRLVPVLVLVLGGLMLVIGGKGVEASSDHELLVFGRTIESDYFRAAQTIQIDGTVNGDAFLMGGMVVVNGTIGGDLFVLGGKVSVNGPVLGSVRVIGGDVAINGEVGRNVAVVAGNVTVAMGAKVSGSVLGVAGNLEMGADVGRGFRFLGGRLYLNSVVSNEAYVVADREFLLGPRASVSGDLKYTGSSEVILSSGATVSGRILYEKTDQKETFPRFFGAKEVLGVYEKIRPIGEVAGFLVKALVGFLLLGLFPKGFEKVVMAMEKNPYACLGWGILAWGGVLMLVVLLAVTIVGVPVSLLLVLVSYGGYSVAQMVVAFFVGRRILLARFGERRGWAIFLGLVVLGVVGILPVVGSLIKFLMVTIGVGGMVLSYRSPAIVLERKLPFERVKRRKGKN